MAGQPEINVGQWALGAWAGLLSLVLGWLWAEVKGVRSRIDQSAKNSQQQSAAGDDKLWAALKDSNDKAEKFREEMLKTMREVPTRHDIEGMERRINENMERLLPPSHR